MKTESPLQPTDWNYRPTHQRIYPPAAPDSFHRSRSLQERGHPVTKAFVIMGLLAIGALILWLAGVVRF